MRLSTDFFFFFCFLAAPWAIHNSFSSCGKLSRVSDGRRDVNLVMNAAPAEHTLRDDLRLLVNSHYPLIAAETSEEDRLEEMLAAIAGEINVPLLIWSRSKRVR